MVTNKPIGVQMYTITGSSNHYVAVYCATHRKQFHIINHSRMIAIIVTVANGAVRLSIGLRLVGFIQVFQKSDANGHHKVESVTKLLSLNYKLNWRQLLFWICFQSASNLVCPSLGDVEKLQKL